MMRTAVRHAWRSLWARPALTLTAVVTLALGVGANAAMLGALGALLFGVPPHVRAPERIVRLYTRQYYGATGWGGGAITSYPVFAAVRDRVPAFARVAAVSGSTGSDVLVGRGTAAKRVPAQLVTHEFWGVVGVRPALGRFFDAADDARDVATPGVVISYDYWRRGFGGDPRALGRVLEVGGVPVRVVGVAPAHFTGLTFSRVDLWLPLVATAPALRAPQVLGPGFLWLQIVARLRDGVAPGVAAAQATAAVHAGDPESVRRQATALVGPLQAARAPSDGDTDHVDTGATTRDHLRWLALMGGALLLAAVATTAGLLLARALERGPELAVRYALGARARHAVRDVAAESALLAALSGGAAVAVAAGFGVAVRHLVLSAEFALLPAVDARVLALVAAGTAAAVVPGALVTLVPAWRAARTAPALRTAGRGRGHVRDARALRPLVAAQVALTFVLLLGAALFARSLGHALGERVGYDLDRVLLVNLEFPAGTSGGAARRTDTYQRLRERVAALPGAERAALTDAPPLQSSMANYLRVPGIPKLPELPGGGPYVAHVEPAYFAATGARVVAGALPSGAARAVVVDARMARTLWPAGGAVGRCMVVGDSTGPCLPVAAVVEDARRFRLEEEAALQYYVVGPFAPADTTLEPGGLLVRARGETAALEAAVRTAARAVDPALPPPLVQRMADVFAPNYAPYRAGATLLSAFAVVATVLCAGGLFGTVSYAAARRARELGLRAALGARAADNVRLLVAGGLVPAAAGLGAGALAFAAAQRTLAALLYGTSAHDWTAVGAAGLVLAAAAGLASWIPARRAARVDPVVALRAE